MENYSLNSGKFITKFGECNYQCYFNLRYIFTHKISEFPNIFFSENIIYCIKNDQNLKLYFGQAKIWGNRFIGHGEFTHYNRYRIHCSEKWDNTALYNALEKYRCGSFTVYLILECKAEDLDDRECYYIDKYHTCIYDPECWGYNSTFGGTDCTQLHTESSKLKRYENNRKNHGGILAFHTPEARAKAKISALNTIAEQYNGDCFGQVHTKEARLNNENSKLINIINTRIEALKSKGLPLTPYNYYHAIQLVNNHNSKTRLHIISITEHMYSDYPIQDADDWDEEWTPIFEWFDNEDNWRSVELGALD